MPANLYDFIADKQTAIVLGKALFWDQNAGSDGLACATCHFHAGADHRTKGSSQSVQPGATVQLTGSAVDPNGANGQPLTYQWSQTAGAPVTLTNANSATPTFVAPAITAGQPTQVLTFNLTVGDALGLSGATTTNVTVQPLQDTITISQASYSNSKNQLQVTAASNVTSGAPVLTLHVAGHPDAAMTFDPTLKQYTAVESFGNPVPTSISVTSSLGGSASSAVTKVR